MSEKPPAGWYPDSTGTVRWWDGEQWTLHTPPSPPTQLAPRSGHRSARVTYRGPLTWVSLGACLLIAIGSLAPWAGVTLYSRSGLDEGGGILTLLLASVAAACLIAIAAKSSTTRYQLHWLLVTAAALVTVVAAMGYAKVNSKEAVDMSEVFGTGAAMYWTVRWGLQVVIVAGVSLVVTAGLLAWRVASAKPRSA